MSSSYTKTFDLTGSISKLINQKQNFTDIIARICLNSATDSLTNLPGKILLKQELLRHMAENQKFSVIHVKLYKKKYKDRYSITGGKHITVLTSKIIKNTVRKYGGKEDFIAHVKGDEFIIITEKELADTICRSAVKCFDRLIKLAGNKSESKNNNNLLARPEEGNPSISMAIIDYEAG
ncbi:MAG: diguanylate cyclase [Desulfotomaculaceae bacterium]|nr:diguanylate cyclase [Desulfotomaculaceae bacterium]